MATEYTPPWLTGAEALVHIAGAGVSGAAGFALLQSAIRNGDVTARARGKDKERRFWVERGLSADDYFVRQVDGPWATKFIDADPGTVKIDAFSTESEVLRADLLRCFPVGAAIPAERAQIPKGTMARAGRKKGDGTYNDAKWLGKMRSMINGNEAKSAHDAAVKVVNAHGPEIEGNGRDAKIVRLRRKFSSKRRQLGFESN